MIYHVNINGRAFALRDDYVVLFVAGWPGGYHPIPNTEKAAAEFQRTHGGVVEHRLISDWEPVAPEHEHEWRPASNEDRGGPVISGEVCAVPGCGAVRS